MLGPGSLLQGYLPSPQRKIGKNTVKTTNNDPLSKTKCSASVLRFVDGLECFINEFKIV